MYTNGDVNTFKRCYWVEILFFVNSYYDYYGIRHMFSNL